ncbi:hypothetical protein BDV11DRAFT_197448 [Aspergillus similis]
MAISIFILIYLDLGSRFTYITARNSQPTAKPDLAMEALYYISFGLALLALALASAAIFAVLRAEWVTARVAMHG